MWMNVRICMVKISYAVLEMRSRFWIEDNFELKISAPADKVIFIKYFLKSDWYIIHSIFQLN